MRLPPNSETSQGAIRFYFSFRSPYAWIAAERVDSELAGLGVPIERIPIFPTPEVFPNDPAELPDKVAYIGQDIPRLARERGLKVRFPPSNDTDSGALTRGLPWSGVAGRRATLHGGGVPQALLRGPRPRRGSGHC